MTTPSKYGLACASCNYVWCIQRRRVVELEAQLAEHAASYAKRTELAREVLQGLVCKPSACKCGPFTYCARARAALDSLEGR